MRLAGQQAELYAEHYLLKQGLSLVAKNYHCRYGELDLIMQDNDELVFIEVRHRTKSAFGSGAESISRTKQHRLRSTARHFLAQQQHGLNQYCRFDVISIDGKLTNHQINWIKNVFSE